ncbi:MAG: hypothetical protein LBT11_03715 [Treponema sp.]|jgi:hypothetical protein|nr:hypothetical protein [Treponema sp.]
MNAIAVTRQELHRFIDTLPDNSISALRPLFSLLVDEQPVIETDLTAEEKAIIAQGRKQRREHPETFVRLNSIR